MSIFVSLWLLWFMIYLAIAASSQFYLGGSFSPIDFQLFLSFILSMPFFKFATTLRTADVFLVQ